MARFAALVSPYHAVRRCITSPNLARHRSPSFGTGREVAEPSSLFLAKPCACAAQPRYTGRHTQSPFPAPFVIGPLGIGKGKPMLRLAASMVCVLVLIIPTGVNAQTQPPASAPKALALASQSIAALTGGTVISDVTLTATATWIAGSDTETGPATLMAKGAGASRIDLSLSGGQRREVRNVSGKIPQGMWIRTDGSSRTFVLHNCWTDASWFFPALSALAVASSDPNVVLSYVGQETRRSVSVQHLRAYSYGSGQAAVQRLSAMDFYLETASLLPLAVVFNTHPDDDYGINIPVEIDYSNYQAVNGAEVPFHVQKLLQGTVSLDLMIGSAVFNSDLSDTFFNVQ
jgi:hypothetical protein